MAGHAPPPAFEQARAHANRWNKMTPSRSVAKPGPPSAPPPDPSLTPAALPPNHAWLEPAPPQQPAPPPTLALVVSEPTPLVRGVPKPAAAPPPPTATDGRIRLVGANDIQTHILHPLREAAARNRTRLPDTFEVNGNSYPLEALDQVVAIDWKPVSRYKDAVPESLQPEKWEAVFFEDEPDPTPPSWPNLPRLDIVITFTNGEWIRWHPRAKLIWSTEQMPTDAMKNRYNRRAKLVKRRS
jgi:hypothetical protein